MIFLVLFKNNELNQYQDIHQPQRGGLAGQVVNKSEYLLLILCRVSGSTPFHFYFAEPLYLAHHFSQVRDICYRKTPYHLLSNKMNKISPTPNYRFPNLFFINSIK